MEALKVFRIPAILAVTFIACGDDETPSGPTPNAASPWKVVFSFDDPKGQWIEDLWFSAPNDGWACMYDKVLHYDGTRWQVLATCGKELPEYAAALTAISAAAPNDVWVGGNACYPDLLYHYDGKGWKAFKVVERVYYVKDIFFLRPNQGWASFFSGSGLRPGTLFYYDGVEWTYSCGGDIVYEELHFVSANNGWAYGYDDKTLKRHFFHYDRDWWEEVQLPGPAPEYYEAIKFSGPDDGWLLGRNGINPVLYHYDGAKWSVVECPLDAKYVYEADFASAKSGWLAAEKSWYYDGQNFTPYPWPYDNLSDFVLWACGENDVWAAAGGLDTPIYLLHFTGFK